MKTPQVLTVSEVVELLSKGLRVGGQITDLAIHVDPQAPWRVTHVSAETELVVTENDCPIATAYHANIL